MKEKIFHFRIKLRKVCHALENFVKMSARTNRSHLASCLTILVWDVIASEILWILSPSVLSMPKKYGPILLPLLRLDLFPKPSVCS